MNWNDILPEIIAIGLGGLGGSMGPLLLVRRPAIQQKLTRLNGLVLSAIVLALVVPGVFVVVRFVQSVRDGLGDNSNGFEITPGTAFLAALAVGLPFAAPHLVVAWLEGRKTEENAQKAKKATRRERQEYINKLREDLSRFGEGKSLELSLDGEKGSILLVKGDLDRQAGDRFTAALRPDLAAFGFKRVEGTGPSGNWWSKV